MQDIKQQFQLLSKVGQKSQGQMTPGKILLRQISLRKLRRGLKVVDYVRLSWG